MSMLTYSGDLQLLKTDLPTGGGQATKVRNVSRLGSHTPTAFHDCGFNGLRPSIQLSHVGFELTRILTEWRHII